MEEHLGEIQRKEHKKRSSAEKKRQDLEI